MSLFGEYQTIKMLIGGGGPAFLVRDTFTGVNGTSLVGRSPDIGNAPAAMKNVTTAMGSNVCQVQSNQAQIGETNHGIVYECSQANVDITVEWTPVVGVDNRNSIVVRYASDGNLWIVNFREPNSDLLIADYQSNTVTVRATTAYTWTEGQTYTIRVVASATTITAYVDGNQELQYASASFNQSATKHGLVQNAGSDSSRFDNLEIIAA